MERESRLGGRVIARAEEMGLGSVKKFTLICQNYRIDCFLINYEGKYRAYVNRCRHMATPLDFIRYQFLSEDGKNLVCLTHGAIYEPETGLCLDGPCKGLSLYRLPLLVDQGDVLVGCPQGDRSFLADLAG
ncbi:MAG: Rieske (2Fe-2S) protein [Candidatus Binatia bacterium]